MNTYRVLLTGSNGAIGKVVARELLAHGHYVRGLDLQANPELPDSHVGSIADADTVDKACAGMDSIIHLAAYPNDADFLSVLLPANIVGLYHVMEAARRHQTRRLVVASSIQAISGLHREKTSMISAADGVAPWNHYGLTKAFAEIQAAMYARRWHMSILAVRIGWLARTVAEVQRMITSGGRSIYLSHRDAATFFRLTVEAENPPFSVLFATSRGGLERYDLQAARAAIGYEPADVFPQGLAFALPQEMLEQARQPVAKH